MKRLYNKALSKAERHRVSDALYRLRKQGFIIPDEEVKKIKDASSYKAIEEQAVKLKGAVYQPYRSTGRRAPAAVPAKLGYELVQEQKKYEKEKKKLAKTVPDIEELAPSYKPESIGPSAFEIRAGRMTKADVEAKTEKRFKEVLKTLKKYTPKELVEKRTKQTIENMLKSLRSCVRPYSVGLYNRIARKLRAMSPSELQDFYEEVGQDVFESMYLYDTNVLKTGIGGGETPISRFLDALGLDPNEEVKNGLTISDIIESM
ncbi:MAG: hypothetical protein J6N21_11825 [Butyrivibrio sp.]|nr:hypothetical protein [Butyrivibrio sp.]